MLRKRIIPCLDIKNGKVVKGINFLGLIDIGDPVEYAKMYEEQCADEIVFLDITASYEERNIIKEIIEKGANELRIPLTVGGGIRTIDDFREILKSGADKVSINSAAVKNPELIAEASREFGKQCVVVAIDGKRDENGDFKVYIKGGRENTGLDLVEWAKKCEKLGVGEILLTSMDADGTKKGYDNPYTSNQHWMAECDAALVASLFHYKEATINQTQEELYRNNISIRRLKK